MQSFTWPMADQFLDRTEELARLERWWSGPERMPVNLYGRRRVGKSWLFRRFANGKRAVILVARKTAVGPQLSAFGRELTPYLGLEPALPDLAALFRVLFRAAASEKLLVVIDEFPWLLPSTEASTDAVLSTIQAVMEEERDSSRLKLILCGSLIGQMESLQAERNPLHGRLIPMQLHPLPFVEASLFLDHLSPVDRFERFAITGGMPRYLDTLGKAQNLKDALRDEVLNRNAPLWDEGRAILEQELREPKMYFAVLQALASGDKELNEVTQLLRAENTTVSKYLSTLKDMRIVGRHLPVGADPQSRSGHWHLSDPFFRFWFRYVFPYQDELENGLSAANLFASEIEPSLNDHVAVEFEQWCRAWTRATHGHNATKVGAWWGRATLETQRSHGRTSEEIDVVGLRRGRITVVGEAKWQNRPLGASIITDLDNFKIPALRSAGYKLSDDVKILLFAKSGYTAALVRAAAHDPRVVIVDVPEALTTAAATE